MEGEGEHSYDVLSLKFSVIGCIYLVLNEYLSRKIPPVEVVKNVFYVVKSFYK